MRFNIRVRLGSPPELDAVVKEVVEEPLLLFLTHIFVSKAI
jgi:hypothetical protein